MLVGLTGTHCTGKTTLAKTVADEFGYGFIRTSISDVLKGLGKDPAVRMTIRERIDAQMAILDRLNEQWDQALKSPDMIWIADRTPIDLMAYLMADVEAYSPMSAEEARDFSLAMRATEGSIKKFDLIIQVQMGIPVAADPEGKLRASHCPIYRSKLEILMRGFSDAHAPNFYALDRDCVDLYERVGKVRGLVKATTFTIRPL